MAQLTKESAVRIIQSRNMVASDANGAKVTCKVLSVGNFTNKDGETVKILNLNIMSNYHLAQAKKFLAEGDYSKAVNQHFTTNKGSKASWCPTAGETINVVIEEVTTSNGVTGQFVTSISALPTAQTTKVSLDLGEDVLEDAEETIEEALSSKK